MGCIFCKQKNELDDNFVCYICLVNRPEYMHYPCCHYGICSSCKDDINITQNSEEKHRCLICKQKADIVKIYFQGECENKIKENIISLLRANNKELISMNRKLVTMNQILEKKNFKIENENKNKNNHIIDNVSTNDNILIDDDNVIKKIQVKSIDNKIQKGDLSNAKYFNSDSENNLNNTSDYIVRHSPKYKDWESPGPFVIN
jgi:hypothetical protein